MKWHEMIEKFIEDLEDDDGKVASALLKVGLIVGGLGGGR